ncbi:hypothetical protein C8R44DRAFT_880855 [Mycena epipterygia]|nr:hypothetical protein C8R44DRAFT_880855 [Mycena epipterygia]
MPPHPPVIALPPRTTPPLPPPRRRSARPPPPQEHPDGRYAPAGQPHTHPHPQRDVHERSHHATICGYRADAEPGAGRDRGVIEAAVHAQGLRGGARIAHGVKVRRGARTRMTWRCIDAWRVRDLPAPRPSPSDPYSAIAERRTSSQGPYAARQSGAGARAG